MAVTYEQALTAQEFHEPGERPCKHKSGPIRWRRNGRTQIWKTRPGQFSIPVKWGLYTFGRITNDMADDFHVMEDCPVST